MNRGHCDMSLFSAAIRGPPPKQDCQHPHAEHPNICQTSGSGIYPERGWQHEGTSYRVDRVTDRDRAPFTATLVFSATPQVCVSGRVGFLPCSGQGVCLTEVVQAGVTCI